MLSIMAITFLMLAQVLMRYVFYRPINSIEELLVVPTIWYYFLGAIYASKKEEHINARLVEILLKKEKSIARLRATAAGLSIVICSWLTYWAYDLCKYSLRMKKISIILKYRLSLIEVALLVCMVFMLFYTIAEFAKYVRIGFGRERTGEEQ